MNAELELDNPTNVPKATSTPSVITVFLFVKNSNIYEIPKVFKKILRD
jgi:hypothetical protein